MNRYLFLLLLFIFSLSLFGVESDDSLKYSRESWRIGIGQFSGDLPLSYEYLKNSIPDLIKRELFSSGIHLLSGKDKAYYRKQLIDEEKKKITLQLTAAYVKKDNLLFSMESGKEDYSQAVNEIDELFKKLELIEQFDSTKIKTAKLLKVQWAGSGDDNNLYKSDEYTSPVRCGIDDLDYLISGRLKEIEDYLLLEIYGFDRSTSEEILLYSNVGTADEIELMAIESANELRSIILGRPWAILKVTTDQPDSMIYADGVLIGIGTAEIKTIEPSIVHIEAIGVDNSYWADDLELKALEINEISGELSVSDIDFLTLTTDPADADVYIGARWAGKTPLKLPKYKEKKLWISIKSDGYYDKSFEISNRSPGELFFQLEIEEMSLNEIFQLRKREFYRSLGWFGISVAAPVVMGGIFSNYIDRHNAYAIEYKLNPDPSYYDLAKEMEQNYYISYGVFWGTTGISGGLLVNLFVKLSRYIKAAEALAE